MLAQNIKQSYLKFATTAKSLLHIEDELHYQQALTAIEELMANDSDATEGLITLLSRAIEDYESRNEDIVNFHTAAFSGPQDVAMLRLLMSQNNLSGTDLPEIGDKTLISKILSGKRNLTKQHIESLCERFHVTPDMFFG